MKSFSHWRFWLPVWESLIHISIRAYLGLAKHVSWCKTRWRWNDYNRRYRRYKSYQKESACMSRSDFIQLTKVTELAAFLNLQLSLRVIYSWLQSPNPNGKGICGVTAVLVETSVLWDLRFKIMMMLMAPFLCNVWHLQYVHVEYFLPLGVN
jgi:hypothetical protein